MTPSPITSVAGLILLLAGGIQTQSFFAESEQWHDRQPRFEQRATAAVQEPAGYTAVCFATNLDTTNRFISADIFDWRGNNVTSAGSCGLQGPGITCQSITTFTDSALRCVVSTSGSASKLRGSLSTSAGAYPFTVAANSTLDAQ